jgi:5-methylcytosine-specific restriction endonuclease McrA
MPEKKRRKPPSRRVRTVKEERDALRYGTAWRRARSERLAFAEGHCEIRFPDLCTDTATEVHHVRPYEEAGHAFDNLRATCHSCHQRLTWMEQTGRVAAAAPARHECGRDCSHIGEPGHWSRRW